MTKKKKTISKLCDSIGWVSFTPTQMKAIGIDPNVHYTADLRKKVFKALDLDKVVKKKAKKKAKKE